MTLKKVKKFKSPNMMNFNIYQNSGEFSVSTYMVMEYRQHSNNRYIEYLEEIHGDGIIAKKYLRSRKKNKIYTTYIETYNQFKKYVVEDNGRKLFTDTLNRLLNS